MEEETGGEGGRGKGETFYFCLELRCLMGWV